jgi:transketolase
MRKALLATLVQLAESDPRVVLLTGDLGFMVVEPFIKAYPSRFFNVGVAEANMIGLATGLASEGFIPYAYSIATFASMRPYEQIRNGPVLHDLPVRILGIGGGFEYGHAGPTHYALEDFGIARVQPGLQVVVPADHQQAAHAIRQTYDYHGPIYYRIGKRDDYVIPNLNGRFRIGHTENVRQGDALLLLSIGSITTEVMAAAEILEAKGVGARVEIVSSLRPAPVSDLLDLLPRYSLVMTVEEHYNVGGLGSLTAEVIAEAGLGCKLIRCGVETAVSGLSGGETYMRNLYGLSKTRIADTVLKELGVEQK